MKYKKRLLCFVIWFGWLFLLSSCSSEKTTIEKLDEHYKKFEEAKALIIKNNYIEQAPISRLRLDWVLGNLFFDAFSQEELVEISKIHNEMIAKSAAHAKMISQIDLDEMRHNEDEVSKFCHALPKGGMLHVHPWGLFTKDIVRKILLSDDPLIEPEALIYKIENREPEKILYENEKQMFLSFPVSAHFSALSAEQQERFIDFFVLPNDPQSHDFRRFDSIFDFVNVVLGKAAREEKLLLAYKGFLKKASVENVEYVEFTEYFSPKLENITQLEKWAELFLKETGIVVRWNISFLRFYNASENADTLKRWNDLLVEHPTDVITGIDFVSLEDGYPALERGQDLYGYLAGYNADHHDYPLDMTMHAGELGEKKNVRDALLLGASRIGHGVALRGDPVTLEYARRMNLPIEVNIQSNHKLGVHNMYKDPHPFLDFLRLGLAVSLSTDNDAIFETNISEECVLAVRTTDIEYSELKQLSYNGINTSFAKPEIREMLIKSLDQSFLSFEREYIK